MAGAKILVYVDGAYRILDTDDLIDVAAVDAQLVYPFTVGVHAGVNINDPCFIDPTGRVVSAWANNESTCRVVGFALSTEAASDPVYLFLTGFVNGATLDGGPLTAGQPVYLSPNVAGSVTATPPVAPNLLVELGIATSANSYLIQIDKPLLRS